MRHIIDISADESIPGITVRPRDSLKLGLKNSKDRVVQSTTNNINKMDGKCGIFNVSESWTKEEEDNEIYNSTW